MAMIEDRKLIHDLRNSVTVIRNLTQLLHEGKMKPADAEQAHAFIMQECENIIALLKDR